VMGRSVKYQLIIKQNSPDNIALVLRRSSIVSEYRSLIYAAIPPISKVAITAHLSVGRGGTSEQAVTGT